MSYNIFSEEETFRLLEANDKDKNLVIEISEGKYAGVKYTYGTTSIEHDEQSAEDETVKLNFEIYMEDESKKDLISDPEFVETAGSILTQILLDYAENGDKDLGSETDRDTNTEESTTE